MRKSYLSVGFSMFVGLLACGDDEGGGGNGSSSESIAQSCARICSRSTAIKCQADIAAECQSDCVNTTTNVIPKSCSSQLQATQDCALKASFACDPEGNAQPVGCDAQIAALEDCFLGAPVPGNDAGGGTQTGNDAGVGQNGNDSGTVKPGLPDGGIIIGDLICQADVEDEACDSCGKSKCCNELKACGKDCQDALTCVANCVDETCAVACTQAHPTGWAQVLAIDTCSTTQCATECADDTETDDCLPGTMVNTSYCPAATHPMVYDCATKPTGCLDSPSGAFGVYCCPQ